MREPPAPARPVRPSRRAAAVAVYVAAAGLGYLVGGRGLPPFRPAPSGAALAAARVGWVFSQPEPQAPAQAWAELAGDVATVREAWPAPLRKLFDLMTAVRGLKSGGQPDWAQAEQLCRALKWSRCDRASLEQLHVRGRP